MPTGPGAVPHAPSVVVFDLGGVLIDWNPRYLYRTVFGDEAEMEQFLAQICSPAWNARQDAGRPWDEAVAELSARHPSHAAQIAMYRDRWEQTLGEAIAPTVEVLRDLHAQGVRLYALTNWSQETFPVALGRFPFLAWFAGILVSGEEGLIKPDPAIYRRLLERFDIDPQAAVFIDDSLPNVEAARQLGLHGIHFHDASALRRALVALGLRIAMEPQA